MERDIKAKGEILNGNIMHIVNTNKLSYCALQERTLKFSPSQTAKAAEELGKNSFQID